MKLYKSKSGEDYALISRDAETRKQRQVSLHAHRRGVARYREQSHLEPLTNERPGLILSSRDCDWEDEILQITTRKSGGNSHEYSHRK
jgi:hypothetical protein